MIAVYPWPFHPEYFRRREIVKDRLRRLKTLGKIDGTPEQTKIYSLASAISPDPFENGDLTEWELEAEVIVENLPEDNRPLIKAPRDFNPSIDAKTFKAYVPNSYAARYGLFEDGPTGHFSPSGKFVKIINTGDTAGTITGPDPLTGNYWSYDARVVFDPSDGSFAGLIYFITGSNENLSRPRIERSIFNSWIGLRADGTMAGGGVTNVTGSQIDPAIRANYYAPESSLNTPGFIEGVEADYSDRPLVIGFPHDPADAGTIVDFAYSTAAPTNGDGWIDASSWHRTGLDRFQFIAASASRSPSSIIDGVAILISGNYALTEDGKLYRYDGQSLSVRATGVYMFTDGRIFFENGTEEEL